MKNNIVLPLVAVAVIGGCFFIASLLPIWPFSPYVRQGDEYEKASALDSDMLHNALAKTLIARSEPFCFSGNRVWLGFSIWRDKELSAKYTSEAVSLMQREHPGVPLPLGYELTPHIPKEIHDAIVGEEKID